MATRVTTKGQVTIPKRVRDHLGIRPGTAVEFDVAADGRIVLKKAGRKRTGTDWARRVAVARRIPTLGLSTEEIMRMTRGDDWKEKPSRRRKAA